MHLHVHLSPSAAESRPALHPSNIQRSDAPALAATLDRLADAELQLGHHAAAEHLAWRADALRSAAR